MKAFAIKIFCLTLLLCSTAIAKPPKGNCYYYQFPAPCRLSDTFCLQYPLLAEDQDGMNYFVYDKCTYIASNQNCQFDSDNNYGWANSSLPYPESCQGENLGYGDCQTTPPSEGFFSKTTFRGDFHQLRKPIAKGAKLEDLMRSKKPSKVSLKAGGVAKWNPKDGIVSGNKPLDEIVWVKAAEGPIPVQLYVAEVSFKEAAKKATPEIKQEHVKFQFKPNPTLIRFGAEVDTDVEWQLGDPIVIPAGTQEFSGTINFDNQVFKIVTNKKLQ